ncbi:hypothetical protein BLNAU_23132 [Blattamonas nauphoetae]|uniref:Right handed beta helix domain-containing protein n=1 Tax=Blattamonas nauphoetae TaxID=2049346 RepID=A0ABQ9WV89_9EUKA|nr:hypothetical protein BLNAU_23132 [Blattamonas nauphoetae]
MEGDGEQAEWERGVIDTAIDTGQLDNAITEIIPRETLCTQQREPELLHLLQLLFSFYKTVNRLTLIFPDDTFAPDFVFLLTDPECIPQEDDSERMLVHSFQSTDPSDQILAAQMREEGFDDRREALLHKDQEDYAVRELDEMNVGSETSRPYPYFGMRHVGLQLVLSPRFTGMSAIYSETIPLAPYFGSLDDKLPTIKLEAGTYVGSDILVERNERYLKATYPSTSVTLNVTDQSKQLFTVNRTTLSLRDVTIIVPTGAHLLWSFNLYLDRVHKNSLVVANEENNSSLGTTVNVVEWDTGNFSIASETPFICNPSVDYLNVKHCNLKNVKFTGSKGAQQSYVRLSQAYIFNCHFFCCDGPLSGGIFPAVQANNVTLDYVLVENCTNTVAISDSFKPRTSYVSITNSTFRFGSSGNTIPDGAGLWIPAQANITLIDVIFANNNGTRDGGGLSLAGGYKAFRATNCQFIANTAFRGGGIYVDRPSGSELVHTYYSNVTFANKGRQGHDIYFEHKGRNVLPSNFVNCTSRSSSPRIYDNGARQGYDWTNSGSSSSCN